MDSHAENHTHAALVVTDGLFREEADIRLRSRYMPLAHVVARVVSTAVALVLASAIALAQSGRSTISGVVRDSSAGAVSLADVIATDEQTGAVTTSYSG